MAVIEVRTCWPGFKLVRERRSRGDRRLREAGDAVHRVRHRDPVPVDGRRLREFVVEDDADPLAFAYSDLTAAAHAVVPPDRAAPERPKVDVLRPSRAPKLTQRARVTRHS